ISVSAAKISATAFQSRPALRARSTLLTWIVSSTTRPWAWPRMTTGKPSGLASAASRPSRPASAVVFTTVIGPISCPSSRASCTKRSTWAWRKRLVPNCRIRPAISGDIDQRLDETALLMGPARQVGKGARQGRAMGDELFDRHLAGPDRRDDPVEIRIRGIAAAQQGHLALVEFRIGEGDGILDHAHQHIAAAMGDEAEALFHRGAVAGGVDDKLEALA